MNPTLKHAIKNLGHDLLQFFAIAAVIAGLCAFLHIAFGTGPAAAQQRCVAAEVPSIDIPEVTRFTDGKAQELLRKLDLGSAGISQVLTFVAGERVTLWIVRGNMVCTHSVDRATYEQSLRLLLGTGA